MTVVESRVEWPEWDAALADFQTLRRHNLKELSFDFAALEAALYSSKAFEHVEAILEEEGNPGPDGRKYVPRLLMALLILHRDAAAPRAAESTLP